MRKFQNTTTGEVLEIDNIEIETVGYGNSGWRDEEGNSFSDGNDLYKVENGEFLALGQDNKFYKTSLPYVDGKQLTLDEVRGDCKDLEIYRAVNGYSNLELIKLNGAFEGDDLEYKEIEE